MAMLNDTQQQHMAKVYIVNVLCIGVYRMRLQHMANSFVETKTMMMTVVVMVIVMTSMYEARPAYVCNKYNGYLMFKIIVLWTLPKCSPA